MVHAARKLLRGAKAAKLSAVDFERRIVGSVDIDQPELSFDMEALKDRMRAAESQYGMIKERRQLCCEV